VTHARPGRVGSIEPRGSAEREPRRRHSTFARLVGATGLVLLTTLLFWMLTDDAFTVSEASVRFEGLAHADEAVVREHLADIDRGPNVFRVRSSDIVGELSTLTEVDAASARVTLPAGVTVALDERDPVFIWSNGALSWLVDEEGMLFAPADEATAAAARAAMQGEGTADTAEFEPGVGGEADPAADAAAELTLTARANLPLVEDARLPAEPPTVGSYLDPIDQQVMRQLLALTPELLGSRATQLELRVDESRGYVLESDRGWRVLFGHYTPTLQPPTVIPRQVQCLQWLLASEERKLEEVWLALSDEACGTYSKIK
jgi:hypothetical protein